jgi:hypothetical protein
MDNEMRLPTFRAPRRLWSGFIAGVALLCLGVLLGTTPSGHTQPVSEETLLQAADSALANAMRNGDRGAARRLLSLQFTFADQNGKIAERKAFLSDLKGAAPGPASDAKVAVYGLVGMVTGTRKSVLGSDVFFIDIWAKQKGAWRALTMQDVVLAPDGAAAGPLVHAEGRAAECKNPCQTIPYRVRSPAEQDVINSFQALAKALVANDAEEWGRHVATEFTLFGSGRTPATREARLATIQSQKASGAEVELSEIESMRLAVYGDGAAMVSMQKAISGARPAHRAARIWVKRNGQWQLVINVETDVKD